jgi:hypothetical protein
MQVIDNMIISFFKLFRRAKIGLLTNYATFNPQKRDKLLTELRIFT